MNNWYHIILPMIFWGVLLGGYVYLIIHSIILRIKGEYDEGFTREDRNNPSAPSLIRSGIAATDSSCLGTIILWLIKIGIFACLFCKFGIYFTMFLKTYLPIM
ncbi:MULTISPECIES: hypothetical protein [unclassified Lactobacillus]|uniref:hypothetical protein n=1 Tax=unclassified Lactobacillus TaxID=2620435 RepID=UPI002269AC02|nr:MULTISPECIES: hypothetical protein [unclassified Lactobacillus]MCX8721255.1 hypothetical protein [Lactobacillus sp. B4010]MCX8731918.1 hypothetical protein [Lactobacillus sp. B4015]MCX8734395.1 hypothetical protein [Lactobacillus sp. B4012]